MTWDELKKHSCKEVSLCGDGVENGERHISIKMHNVISVCRLPQASVRLHCQRISLFSCFNVHLWSMKTIKIVLSVF